MGLVKEIFISRGRIFRNEKKKTLDIVEVEGTKSLFASDEPITLIQSEDKKDLIPFVKELFERNANDKPVNTFKISFGFPENIDNLFNEDYLLHKMERFNYSGNLMDYYGGNIYLYPNGFSATGLLQLRCENGGEFSAIESTLYDIIWDKLPKGENDVIPFIYMEIIIYKGE